MTGLELAVPSRRTSAWVVETDPRYARAWLASLPLADSAEMARELYQALYTLNRQALEADQRAELLGMYEAPVAGVCQALQSHLSRPAYPLSSRKRQTAEFIRQLHIEMANGYKLCLLDFLGQRFVWRPRSRLPRVIHRAIYYLEQVLLRSYQTYLPYPAQVWRDLHRLYHHAEQAGWIDEAVDAPGGESAEAKFGIAHDYRRALLLAASQPYQLPQDECLLVYRLLDRWADLATLENDVGNGETANCLVIDIEGDAPPMAYAGQPAAPDNRHRRFLKTTELVRTMNGFEHRLRKGEPVASLGLGIDCLETTCQDLLRRLIRSWGVAARRQHKRIKRKEYVSICVGISALNFFSSGQHVLRSAEQTELISADRLAGGPADAGDSVTDAPVPRVPDPGQETFRVDRWQVVDVSPRGLQLSRPANAGVSVRVGDVLGLQRPEQPGIWSVAVVRWLRNSTSTQLEIGAELLGPQARPVTVRVLAGNGSLTTEPALAVMLPPIEPLHRPATLLAPRGYYQISADYEVAEEKLQPRRVRALQLLERSGSFEQIVFADLLAE